MSHEELFEKYFTGQLDQAEAARLKALLSEPEGGKQFVEHLRERSALMRVTGRLPAEPARPVQNSRKIPWASLAAVAASVVILVVALRHVTSQSQPSPPDAPRVVVRPLAEITQASGGVLLLRNDRAIVATAGVELRAGDVVRTGVRGSAILQLTNERTSIDLQQGVDLALSPKAFTLNVGRIEADVAPREPWRRLLFRTPHAQAEVIGTRLVLAVSKVVTRLEVSRGKVRLSHATRDQSVLVDAGYFAEACRGSPLVSRPQRSVAAPTIHPPGGRYSRAQSVVLRIRTPGAALRYTVDGSAPTLDSALYKWPVDFRKTATLRVRGFKEGFSPSPERTARFEIFKPKSRPPLPLASPPTLDPSGGRFVEQVRVVLESQTRGAVIRYTLDGSQPAESSMRYREPLRLRRTTTVKARAFAARHRPSPITAETFEIRPKPKPVVPTVLTPTIDPRGGTFVNRVEVAMRCSTPDATVCYTLDGSEPTERSRRFERGQIALEKSATLKVRAFRKGWKASPVVSASFKIEKVKPRPRVATPRIQPHGGEHRRRVKITLQVSTPGAYMRYSFGGPVTDTSPIYQKVIKLKETATIRVRAYRRGMLPSETVTARFEIVD